MVPILPLGSPKLTSQGLEIVRVRSQSMCLPYVTKT